MQLPAIAGDRIDPAAAVTPGAMPLLVHHEINQLVGAARQLPDGLVLTPAITSRQDQQRG